MRYLALLLLLALPGFAVAAENPKPDDTISLQLASEAWVTTQTAKVNIQVHAAVSAENASSTRNDMLKAVKQVADADWRIINFNRSQSETGYEDWYAEFEARLPEAALGGLNEKLKKSSKAGMQLTVGNIEFTPTLAETEAARANLRKSLMEQANAELKNVQAAFPDRGYRIAEISFGGVSVAGFRPNRMMAKMAMAPQAMDASEAGTAAPLETAQKLNLTATVTFAALAPASLQPGQAK